MALGGIGTTLGALLGGILLGFIESLGGFLNQSRLGDAIRIRCISMVLMLNLKASLADLSGRQDDRAMSPTYHADRSKLLSDIWIRG